MSRQAAPQPARDVLDERRISEDEPVAQHPVAVLLELAPERLRILLAFDHVQSIRRADA
jgi:hypothetical protein